MRLRHDCREFERQTVLARLDAYGRSWGASEECTLRNATTPGDLFGKSSKLRALKRAHCLKDTGGWMRDWRETRMFFRPDLLLRAAMVYGIYHEALGRITSQPLTRPSCYIVMAEAIRYFEEVLFD